MQYKHKQVLASIGGFARWALLAVPLAGHAANTSDAELPAGVDLSAWVCKYCAFQQGWTAQWQLGLGWVSEDAAKFGEYSGLDESGAFVLGEAGASYRDEQARYLELGFRELGGDSLVLNVEGGRQGRYSLWFDYNQMPHTLAGDLATPYLGSGGDTLTLPGDWVNAGSTATMSNLAASLNPVALSSERRRLNIGASFIPARRWETSVNVRHEERDGGRRSGAAFFFNTALLIEPVDYQTNELELSASYTTRDWQSQLAYSASYFQNRNSALTWENAYNPIVSGADTGQLALPPDNQAHQLSFISAYRLSPATRLSGNIALGHMQQDDRLLAATLNPNIAVAAPNDSARASVDTLSANLKFDTRVSNKLRLRARYHRNERDNQTPSDDYQWVAGDAFVALTRKNLPYSFTNQDLTFEGDYRWSRTTKLSAGYDYQIRERSHQEVDETKEGSLWGAVRWRAGGSSELTMKAAHAERDASGYHPVAELNPAQNPLLRKYNMADRERDSASLGAGFNLGERARLELGIDNARDSYSESLIGLSDGMQRSYTSDFAVSFTELSSGHLFASRERIESRQHGSQAFALPDWLSAQRDIFTTFGAGAKQQLLHDKLVLGADYLLSRSHSNMATMVSVLPSEEFPALSVAVDSFNFYADYALKPDLSLHVRYWYERYSTSDWTVDGVDLDTLANVLGLGERAPNYNVHALSISLEFRLH